MACESSAAVWARKRCGGMAHTFSSGSSVGLQGFLVDLGFGPNTVTVGSRRKKNISCAGGFTKANMSSPHRKLQIRRTPQADLPT